MFFDLEKLPPPDRYKLLGSTIVPRPIAWVVSLDAGGRLNAAPYSFFNAFGENPPIICIGIGGRQPAPAHTAVADVAHKDTAANIRATGEFVVNLVSENLMHAMHVTAIEFEHGVDEIAEAGLTTLPSARIRPPRIAESPVALECRRHTIVEFGTDRTLVVGEVLAMHIRDDAVIDAARCHIDTAALDLVGRSGGPDGYVRATGPGLFRLARFKLRDWVRRT